MPKKATTILTPTEVPFNATCIVGGEEQSERQSELETTQFPTFTPSPPSVDSSDYSKKRRSTSFEYGPKPSKKNQCTSSSTVESSRYLDSDHSISLRNVLCSPGAVMDGTRLYVSFESSLVSLRSDEEFMRASSLSRGSCDGCLVTMVVPQCVNLDDESKLEDITGVRSMSNVFNRCLLASLNTTEETGLTPIEKNSLERSVRSLLCHDSDDIFEIMFAVKRHRNVISKRNFSTPLLGAGDFLWWADSKSLNRGEESDSPFGVCLQELALVRRISSPLILRLYQLGAATSMPVMKHVPISLLDVLLSVHLLRNVVIDSLFYRLCQLDLFRKCDNALNLKKCLFSHIDRAAMDQRIPCMDRDRLLEYIRLLLLLSPTRDATRAHVLRCLANSVEQRDITDNEILTLQRNAKRCSQLMRAWKELGVDFHWDDGRSSLPIQRLQHVFSKPGVGHGMEARSCPSVRRVERLIIRQHRCDMIDEWERRKRHLQNSCAKASNGSLLITSDAMSVSAFLKRADIMEKTNATFPRSFQEGYSRPKLRRLNISFTSHDDLLKLFFDADGSLSDEISNDVEISDDNDPRYITFLNKCCAVERMDRRWQVPIQKHTKSQLVGTRSRVESILASEKVVDSRHEKLHDIGLLFGGTEDQSLHHDLARKTTTWTDQKHTSETTSSNVSNRLPGWEVDRLEYNEAMASPNAPSSIIIGLGPTGEVLLGVQKDLVELISCNEEERQCRIRDGDGTVFTIVRETELLVVIKVINGCMFTGDFQHAGVRNFPESCYEADLMDRLIFQIDEIIERFPSDEERVTRNKAMLEMMCEFPELNKLCRLHCSTEMTAGKLFIPHNMIGFHDCLANAPDRRCFQDEQRTEAYNGMERK